MTMQIRIPLSIAPVVLIASATLTSAAHAAVKAPMAPTLTNYRQDLQKEDWNAHTTQPIRPHIRSLAIDIIKDRISDALPAGKRPSEPSGLGDPVGGTSLDGLIPDADAFAFDPKRDDLTPFNPPTPSDRAAIATDSGLPGSTIPAPGVAAVLGLGLAAGSRRRR